jgi:hypothetical protein
MLRSSAEKYFILWSLSRWQVLLYVAMNFTLGRMHVLQAMNIRFFIASALNCRTFFDYTSNMVTVFGRLPHLLSVDVK